MPDRVRDLVERLVKAVNTVGWGSYTVKAEDEQAWRAIIDSCEYLRESGVTVDQEECKADWMCRRAHGGKLPCLKEVIDGA